MKTWLLDADITIDFLSFDVLDNLVRNHEIYVSSSVIREITHYKKMGSNLYPLQLTQFIPNLTEFYPPFRFILDF